MYIGIDLGSTNIKAAIYGSDLKQIAIQSKPVVYDRTGGFVEFDAEQYCEDLFALLHEMLAANQITEIAQIAFTGQAESLIVLGKDGKPLMPAISWMDERSQEECRLLEQQFSPELCEQITGQQAVLPTWPATKILWLQRNRPEVFENAACYMLLKDYIIYRFTGLQTADMSIATFTFYFDIYRKCYWEEMLQAIGITTAQLPALIEPCSIVGGLCPDAAAKLGLSERTKINTGTLDHFAGMIGTGNVTSGGVTLSTGTVMALAVMGEEPVPRNSGIAMHYGFIPDTHVMLPVAESGGVSLEWFRRTCMNNVDYALLNQTIEQRPANDLLFLPYLVGTNAPEFDSDATGVFWGLRQEHDAFDMAAAVMEGVAFVLRKNTENILQKGTALHAIIATGGGAKSPLWCQMQADITGLPVRIPKEKEAACLGAAMIAAVADGQYSSFGAAAEQCVSFANEFIPHPSAAIERKYRRFCTLYQAAVSLARDGDC